MFNCHTKVLKTEFGIFLKKVLKTGNDTLSTTKFSEDYAYVFCNATAN